MTVIPTQQPLGVEDYWNNMWMAEEHMQQAIRHYENLHPHVWHKMMKKESYEFYNGYEQSVLTWFDDPGTQIGLDKWSDVQASRNAEDGDLGYDNCAIDAEVFNNGIKEIAYTGIRRARRSHTLCRRDLMHQDKGPQQFKLMFQNMANISMREWDTLGREYYMSLCSKAGRAYVLCGGNPTAVTFTYDPRTPDADGDIIAVANIGSADNEVSTLNFNAMQKYRRMIEKDCPMAALAYSDGKAIIGAVFDTEDYWEAVNNDEAMVQRYEFLGDRKVLIDQWGMSTEVRGYAFMHDREPARFAIKKYATNSTTFKRIAPYTFTDETTIGFERKLSEDYIDAEYAILVGLINEVVTYEVPTNLPTNPGGGLEFGNASLDGTFSWINNKDNINNPKGDKGYFLAEFEAYTRPELYYNKPFMVMYKRCLQNPITSCDLGTTAVSSAEIGLASNAVAADIDATNYTITLTLTDKLARDTGNVTISDDDAATDVGIIADASNAPTYTFALATAPSAFGKYTAAGAAFVKLS